LSNTVKNISIILFVVLLSFTGYLYPQGAKIKPVLLTDNLYLISGLGGNIIFLVTEGEVLVVDSGSMSIHGKQITEAIAEITPKPIKYLVLTHYHYDHTGGVKGFASDVEIVGHSKLEKNLRKNSVPLIDKLAIPQFKVYLEVLEAKVKKFQTDKSPHLEEARKQLTFVRSLYNELKNFTPFRPDITFDHKHVIHLGGETIELIYKGPGHTDDGCLVYFPEKKVLHTGDLFVNRVCPFIDELANADIQNWIIILQDIMDHWKVDIIVPGHGKHCGKEDVKLMRNLLFELHDRIEKSVEKGLSLEQTLKQINLPSFKDLPGLDLLKYNIEAVYNTLKKK